MSSNIRITRVCDYCETEFTARTSVTKYCQHRCAALAYKQRTRNVKIALSNKDTAVVLSASIAQVQAKEFLSIGDAAKLLGISRWTVARAIKHKRLRAVRIGRRVVITRNEIERMFSMELELRNFND